MRLSEQEERTPDPECERCHGEGVTFGVYGQLDTMAPCSRCNPTEDPSR